MKKIELILETCEGDDSLWGRAFIDDDLLTTSANNVEGVITNIQKQLKDFYQIEEVEFVVKYDIQAIFSAIGGITIHGIANRASINSSLLRQYVSGKKHLSANQAIKVQSAINNLGKELSKVKLVIRYSAKK